MRPAQLRLAPLVAAVGTLAVLASFAPTVHAAGASVQIADMAFAPGEVTVSVGDTVTWTNTDDGIVHTVTSTTGAFDSGDLGDGESYSVTFTAPGTFAYLCTPHPFMTGTVTVVAAAAAPSPGAVGQLPNVAMPVSEDGSVRWLGLVGVAMVAIAVTIGLRSRRTMLGERKPKRID